MDLLGAEWMIRGWVYMQHPGSYPRFNQHRFFHGCSLFTSRDVSYASLAQHISWTNRPFWQRFYTDTFWAFVFWAWPQLSYFVQQTNDKFNKTWIGMPAPNPRPSRMMTIQVWRSWWQIAFRWGFLQGWPAETSMGNLEELIQTNWLKDQTFFCESLFCITQNV